VSPVGAWFSQVGRLHHVHHMWQYPYVIHNLFPTGRNLRGFYRNLETRKEKREEAWELDGWAETVSKVSSDTNFSTYNDTPSADGTIGQIHGFLHSSATSFQPPKVKKSFVYHSCLVDIYFISRDTMLARNFHFGLVVKDRASLNIRACRHR
jgi:hypothetical protein